METPGNDLQLAKQLGTDRKSLRRWRKQFAAEAPATRDATAWRKFAADNLLGPFSAQRGYGESVARPTPPLSAAQCVMDCAWSQRHTALFGVMDVLHEAYADNNLDPVEYADIGNATFDKLCELAAIWGIPKTSLDPLGWRRTWNSILADLARTMGPTH